MGRLIILLIIIACSVSTFSQDKRLYQLVSNKENESFIAIEAGSYIGASLVSKRMELSLGYNYLSFPGYFISTELYLLKLSLTEDITFGTGIGGGIVLSPDLEGFSSDAYLRVPLRLRYKNFFVKAVPMIGSSMFKTKLDWKLNFFIGIGYQFDLYREKTEETETKVEDQPDTPKEITKEESEALRKKYEAIQEEEMRKQNESAE